MLGIISPRNHAEVKGKSLIEIRDRSKKLAIKYCDWDKVYNPKVDDSFKLEQPAEPEKIKTVKPLRKHDRVRLEKQENDKLLRIERDLFTSVELKEVQKLQDIYEFEY